MLMKDTLWFYYKLFIVCFVLVRPIVFWFFVSLFHIQFCLGVFSFKGKACTKQSLLKALDTIGKYSK